MKLNDKKTKLALSTLVVAASISTANAALPEAAQAAFDSVTASVTDVSTAAYALLAAVLVPGIIIKLVKKFTNKAS